MRPDLEAPLDLRELSYCEHLLIWSLRAFAVGRWECAMIEREYRDACGVHAQAARTAMEVFAKEIQLQGRRPILLSPPGIASLTRDEQQLLAIFAAAEADDEVRCSAHLSWLLSASPTEAFFRAARVVARALTDGGHRAPERAAFRSVPAVLAAPPLRAPQPSPHRLAEARS